MSSISRRRTPEIFIGPVRLGGDDPIVIQTMTDTATADVEATLAQTIELIEAGAEIVRWTVNDSAAAVGAIEAITRLRQQGIITPIVGDLHFNGHTLLEKHPDLAEALDKYRINPGNVGRGASRDENFARIIRVAIKHNKPVRIGVNWGSLDPEVVTKAMDEARGRDARAVVKDVIIETALANARYAEELGLAKDKIVLSAKMSHVADMVEVYERLALKTDHALHLGLTEAGGGLKGAVASASALAILLSKGIGDTIRVSVTPEPGTPRSREVEICRELLQALGLRYFSPSVTSCPGCGRTKSTYFRELAQSVCEHIALKMPEWKTRYPGVEKLEVAVMGCVVNGPGESKHADIGISLPGAFEEPVAPVFIEGEKVTSLKGARIKEEFLTLLEDYIAKRYGA